MRTNKKMGLGKTISKNSKLSNWLEKKVSLSLWGEWRESK